MSTIDRVAPTRRPRRAAIMKQKWRKLLFLHWPVPSLEIQRLMPQGLEVDTHDGVAWVGLVPFTVFGARPVGVPPLPGISRFHEVNVRTYVHAAGRHPGVWFFSLDASNLLVVKAARLLFQLAYRHARITFEAEGRHGVRFASERLGPGPLPARCRMTYAPTGPASTAEPGTLEHFLAERYVLYARSAEGQLFRGQVHHAPYPLQNARVSDLEEDLVGAAGIARPQEPPLAHYAQGVDVDIFTLQPVT